MEEHYGDVHLHHSLYPDYPGVYGQEECRFNSSEQDHYDKMPGQECEGAGQCHVEYCHPGSWQGKQEGECDGRVKLYQPHVGDDLSDKYDKYDKDETQRGHVCEGMCGSAHGEVVEGMCGCVGAPRQERVLAPQKAEEEESDLMSAYRLVVTLFVLAVLFLAVRMALRRLL
jgi:hypothetical protein